MNGKDDEIFGTQMPVEIIIANWGTQDSCDKSIVIEVKYLVKHQVCGSYASFKPIENHATVYWIYHKVK